MYKRLLTLLIVLCSAFNYSPQPAYAQAGIMGPIYVVQAGDNLSSIASRFSVSIDDLMSANEITDANSLFAGQQLVIPGLEGVTGTFSTEDINFGDSFRSLIRRTQVPLPLFKKINRIVSPSEFHVGAKMIVPVEAGTQILNTRMTPAIGESLLELAIKNNTDTWTLSHYNKLQGTWDGIPGDTLLAAGLESDQAISGLPTAFISAEIQGLPIKQGGTAVIKIKTDPGVTLGGSLVDHPLHFFPVEDGTQVALQGVHALILTGVYPIRLEATLADGSKQSYEQFIPVTSGNYLTGENLPVDPFLIDPAVTEPEQQQLEGITLPATPTKYWGNQFLSPASNYAETTFPTSFYGTSRVYLGQGTDLKINWWHTGIDFGGGTGLPITAPAAGQVVFAGFLTVRGNATIIDHGWGVYSGFWHQSEIQVQVGDVIEQGQVIGLVGGTGRVTGPHLHWELWVNGIQVDPLDWLNQVYP